MTNEELAGKIELVLANQAEVKEDVTVLKTIMTGNGNPSKGFIVRFALVESWQRDQKKFGTAMLLAGGTGVLSLVGSVALLVIRIKWGV